MSLMNNSFRNFFINSFKEEKAYLDFDRHFREMAEPFHVRSHMPANLDEDDIEFLSQFPHEYWKKALAMRHNMLFKKLEELQKNRETKLDKKGLEQKIVKAIETGNWDGLQGVVPERNMRHLSRIGNRLSPNEKIKDAQALVHRYMREKMPHVTDNNDEVSFSFGKGKNSKVIMARPFLNRLYHKYETTPGHPFHKESGLEGTGKYGYDMVDPMRIDNKPHSAAGWKVPTGTQVDSAVKKLLNYNMHRIFGDLPEDVEWLPVPGYKDDSILQHLKDDLIAKLAYEIEKDPRTPSRDVALSQARMMANERLVDMANKGQLKGAPVPGKFPDGIPVKVEGGKLVAPPLYLPHEPKNIKTVDETGRVNIERKMIPLIKPATFFRRIGDLETDYKMDKDGKRMYDPDGNPVYNVPDEKRRGFDKSYIHVSDDEYLNGPNNKVKGAGPHINAETEDTLHLTKGDPGWEEAWQKIFASQKTTDIGFNQKGNVYPVGEGPFYEDIVKGIGYCGSRCGGATAHEMNILRANAESFHNMVVIKMLNNMGDERLHTPEGRRHYSYNKVSTIIQRDQKDGGGSRRLRKFHQQLRNVSLDSGGGEDANIADILMSKIAGNGKLDVDRKRGKGERKLGRSDSSTDGDAFQPYNITYLRELLSKMQEEAQDADRTSDHALETSRQGIKSQKVDEDVIGLLRNGVNKQIDFKLSLTDTLAALYQLSGQSKSDATNTAQSQIKSWIEEGVQSSEAMLQAFKSLPVVQEAIRRGGGEVAADTGAQEQDAKQAMQLLQSTMDRMRDANIPEEDIKDKVLAKPGEKYSILVRQLVGQNFNNDEGLMNRLQSELNRQYRVQAANPIPATQAAREITPKAQAQPQAQVQNTSIGHLNDLIQSKNWMDVAHHPEYLSSKVPALVAQRRKLLQFLTSKRDSHSYDPQRYESAIRNLEQSLGGL